MRRYKLEYFLKKDKVDAISIYWEQGLQNFKAYYRNVLFFESKGIGELNKGVTVYHEELGNVFIRFCSRPIGFEVKVGDVYLENSRILAQEALSTISAIWIFVGVVSTLSTIGFALLPFVFFDTLALIILGLMFAFSIFYVVAGLLIKKGMIWAYYTSLGIFTGMTLLYLVAFDFGNIPILVTRAIVILVVVRHFSSMRDLYRHYKAKRNQKGLKDLDTILDQ
jgi:hypothetical protein